MVQAASPRLGRPRDPALRARRRQEILDAAMYVFAERGYPETDLEVVGARAGVSKGSVYRYFRSKAALFLATVDHGMKQLTAVIEAQRNLQGDALDSIARAIRAYLEFFEQHPAFVELLIQERAQFRHRKKPTYFRHREANLGPWRELIGDLIQKGRMRDIPVERITTVVGDLLYGTMFTNYFAGRKRAVDEQLTDILDIVWHGILGERERGRPRGNNC